MSEVKHFQLLKVSLRGGQTVEVPFKVQKPGVLNPQIEEFMKALGDSGKRQGNFLFQGARVVLVHLPDVSAVDVTGMSRRARQPQAAA